MSNNPLSGLDFDRWYIVWIAACLAVLLGAMFADKMNIVGLAAGLGLIGFSELVNHPKRLWLDYPMKYTIRARETSFIGILFLLAGFAMTGWFAYQLFRA